MNTTKVMNPAAAAEFLTAQGYKISLSGLAARRQRKAPPVYRKIGGRPVYTPEDLLAFLEGEPTT